MMKIEFVMILALCISGMINYLVSWLTDDEREKNKKTWGRSGPSNIKDLVIATIFFVVLVALGSYMFFIITEKVDVGYTIYVAIFESLMISLYLSIRFIEKNGDLKRFGELLGGHILFIPIVGFMVYHIFTLAGYVDIGNSLDMTYSFILIASAAMIFGVQILAVEAVYFYVRDMTKIDSWMQRILNQEKKVLYALIATTIIALMLAM